MGVVKGFKGAGIFAKIAFVLLILAAIGAWIAYNSTGWGRCETGASDTHMGLWRTCSDSTYISSPGCTILDGWALDWYGATQWLVAIGFYGTNLSLFLVALYMFVRSCTKDCELGVAAAIIAIFTGVLYLIGCIVFAVKFKDHYIDPVTFDCELSYCFIISIIALVLEILAGVLMILDAKKAGTSPSG